MDLESQPFDLRECVESAVDLRQPEPGRRDWTWDAWWIPTFPSAIVRDVTRLRKCW